MKKKGFTLIELLAVIVVLAVIGLITVPIVIDNIERSRVETYRNSVQNAIEAAKEYVSRTSENNDFPINGVDITKINLKNNNFEHGIITKNEKGEIVAVNVYDGTYCSKGTKTDLIVEKVDNVKDCEKIDATAPEIKKIVVNKKTSTSITITTLASDYGVGIKGYVYCIGDNCSSETKENTYKFTGLKENTNYKIKVKVRNNNYGKEDQYKENITEATKSIEVKTLVAEPPVIKVSTLSYSSAKKVTIRYPKIEGKNSYYINEEEKIVEGNETEFTITSNCIIKAVTKTEDEELIDEIMIVGIDNNGPTIEKIEMTDKWERQKTVKIYARDVGVGLPKNAYSFDGGKTWTSNRQRTFTKNGVIVVAVRDTLGNKTTKEFNVNRVDRTPPTCSLKVISGTLGQNGWYISNVGIGFNSFSDKESGINTKTINTPTVTKEGGTTITGTVYDNAGNIGTCNLTVKIDKTAPTCISSGGSTTWTNASRTLIGTCSDSMSGCRNNANWTINWEGSWTNLSPGTVYDNAGNSKTCPANQTVRIEKSVSTPSIGGGGTTDNDPIIIYLSRGSSATSGINRYQYCISTVNYGCNGGWQDLNPIWTPYWPVFDAPYYWTLYGDLRNAFGTNATSLYNHFVNNGMNEGRRGSQHFDVNIYRNNYGDLRSAFGGNLRSYYEHYINYGQREGRNAGYVDWVRTAQVINTQGVRYIYFRAVSNAGNVSANSNVQTTTIRVYGPSNACGWNNCLTGSPSVCVGGYVSSTGYGQCAACGAGRCKSYGYVSKTYSNIMNNGGCRGKCNNNGYKDYDYDKNSKKCICGKYVCTNYYYAYCNSCPIQVWSNCASQTPNTCQGGWNSCWHT